MFVLVEGGGDHHTLLGRLGKHHVEGDGRAGLAKVVQSAVETASGAIVEEVHIRTAYLGVDVTLFARPGHTQRTQGESIQHTVVDLEGIFAKAQQRDVQTGDETCVRDSQTQTKLIVTYVVVVPLLDTDFGGFDVGTVILPQKTFGIAGTGNIALGIE